jgi:hypothetical protein
MRMTQLITGQMGRAPSKTIDRRWPPTHAPTTERLRDIGADHSFKLMVAAFQRARLFTQPEDRHPGVVFNGLKALILLKCGLSVRPCFVPRGATSTQRHRGRPVPLRSA